MEEQRKYAILFAATILAARRLSDPDIKPFGRSCAIDDAIEKAEQILEEPRCRSKIDPQRRGKVREGAG